MTDEEWRDALDKIYLKARSDLEFRALCLANPLEAVLEVSGIQLPADTKLNFWVDSLMKFYSYELPPVREQSDTQAEDDAKMIRWATQACTDRPTS